MGKRLAKICSVKILIKFSIWIKDLKTHKQLTSALKKAPFGHAHSRGPSASSNLYTLDTLGGACLVPRNIKTLPFFVLPWSSYSFIVMQGTFWFHWRLWFIMLFAWRGKTSTQRSYLLFDLVGGGVAAFGCSFRWSGWYLNFCPFLFGSKWCSRACSWISRCCLFQEKMKLFLPSRHSSLNCEETFLFAQREITSRFSSSTPP